MRIRSGWVPFTILLALCSGLTVLTGGQRPLFAQGAVNVPPAQYEVSVDKDVMVPVRDGTRLATDIYRPEGVEEPLPVILIRLPYNKDRYGGATRPARFLAARGYVVVVQDVRGRNKSEGTYRIYEGDLTDGYDAVEWAASQPWSSGKVGMYGCSYLGETQIVTASTLPPSLTTLLPQAAGGVIGTANDRHTYFGYIEGGAIALSAGFGWFQIMFPSGNPMDFSLLESLPTIDMLQKAGTASADWDEFFTRELDDPHYTEIGYISDDDRFDVPSLHVNSWYDLGVGETLYLFNLMRENAESDRGRDSQFAIISPSSHCASESMRAGARVGDLEVGDPRLDYLRIYLDWFDFWLKGTENGVTGMPRLQLYVIGRNEWIGADEWPLVGTRFTDFYLHSAGKANTRDGDGALSTEKPARGASDSFVYDPANPVPSRGGSLCCTGNPDDQPGSFDQSDLQDRQDVLVYTSPPLEESLQVVGPLSAVLYVSSSAKDTDFTVKLLDVYPDGRAFNIQEAILRARYREGFDQEVWMEPGEIYEMELDLHATGYEFQPGHRIRVDVSSSNFPRFDRNLNTGGNNYDESEGVKATNSVHHSAEYPSRIVLPVVPR